jgi:hypothetical protein
MKHDSHMSKQQECYSFTLLLAGFDDITQELEDAVFEAGCADALLGIHCGIPYLAFDREASSLDEAIKSAIAAVEKVQARGIKIEVVRVIPPGEDTIEKFNAYLRLRRQYLGDKGFPPELREQIVKFLAMLLEHDPEQLKAMLAKNSGTP